MFLYDTFSFFYPLTTKVSIISHDNFKRYDVSEKLGMTLKGTCPGHDIKKHLRPNV